MKLAVFGGAFNPPHTGHIALARAAAVHLKPDTLLWLPSGDPPHKRFPENTPDVRHRLAMTCLAAAEVPGSAVSDIEMTRGLRYTADTLAELHAFYRPDELWLLVGGDMLMTIDQWYAPRRLFALCSVAVFAREPQERERLEAKAQALREQFEANVRFLRHSVRPISSTAVRERIPRGEGASCLSPAVYDYLCAEKLYGVSAGESLSPPLLRRLVRGRLSERRAAHVFGVEEEAAALAALHGVSETKARQAALLHDITKEEANQLNLLESCDILPTIRETLVPPIYHGWTAAAFAEQRGADAALADAVRYHSTGRAGMSALEAVIFLSDMTEAGRPSYPGQDELRAESRRDLRAALLLALRRKKEYLQSRGFALNPFAAEALAWLETQPAALLRNSKEGCSPI